ncbi:hypothetical protein [Paraburkholderia sediminicola]|uniref:hypothetical protein n=1 Tax=Paraburkholderia sediminicola TaxID=458836 RepID=UPI0038B76B1C
MTKTLFSALLAFASVAAQAKIIGHQVTQAGHHVEFSDRACAEIPARTPGSMQLRSMDGYEAVVENAQGGIDNLGCAQSREGVTAVTWINTGEQTYFMATDMKLGE